MVMGRPEKYNREEIAKSLIEWAQKDDSINLNGFCVQHDPMIPPSCISIWAKENKNFSKAYEIAKACIAARREKKLNNSELHVKAYDLNASVYDHFLKMERRSEKEYEAQLKKMTESFNEDDKKSFISLMNQLKSIQLSNQEQSSEDTQAESQ